MWLFLVPGALPGVGDIDRMQSLSNLSTNCGELTLLNPSVLGRSNGVRVHGSLTRPRRSLLKLTFAGLLSDI